MDLRRELEIEKEILNQKLEEYEELSKEWLLVKNAINEIGAAIRFIISGLKHILELIQNGTD